jgi:tRNA dimethylallyltransferase
MSVLPPLVAIVGTTGVSKSRLAVELALHLRRIGESAVVPEHGFRGGQVINADAMQVYKGLDLITNKMSTEEQCGIPHHLLGFREPGDQYLVTDWVRDASDCIDKIYTQRELPIVIGGTAYWLQNLILAKKLASLEAIPKGPNSKLVSKILEEKIGNLNPTQKELWDSLPSIAPRAEDEPTVCYSLYGLLQWLDPATAARWHWKDARRVLTSLRVIKEQGMEASKVLAEQESSAR